VIHRSPPVRYESDKLVPEDPYFSKWSKIRRTRVISFAAWLTFLPGMAIMMSFLVLPLQVVPYLYLALFFVIGGAWLLAIYSWKWCKCPRCRRPFYSRGQFDNWPLKSHCVHCHLPQYAPHDDLDDDVVS
jgi:hypothetical protein